MNIEDKKFIGIGKVESPPDIEQADVSNKMGAAIGSSGNLYFRMKWIYDVFAPFEAIGHIINSQSFGQDVEVYVYSIC